MVLISFIEFIILPNHIFIYVNDSLCVSNYFIHNLRNIKCLIWYIDSCRCIHCPFSMFVFSKLSKIWTRRTFLLFHVLIFNEKCFIQVELQKIKKTLKRCERNSIFCTELRGSILMLALFILEAAFCLAWAQKNVMITFWVYRWNMCHLSRTLWYSFLSPNVSFLFQHIILYGN